MHLAHDLLTLIDLLTIKDEVLYTLAVRKLKKTLSTVVFDFRKKPLVLAEYYILKVDLLVDFRVGVYHYLKVIQPPYIVNHEVDTIETRKTYSDRFSSVLSYIRSMDYYYGVLSNTPTINVKAVGDTW